MSLRPYPVARTAPRHAVRAIAPSCRGGASSLLRLAQPLHIAAFHAGLGRPVPRPARNADGPAAGGWAPSDWVVADPSD